MEEEGAATKVWDGKKVTQMRFDLAIGIGQDPARHNSKTDQDRHFFLKCLLKLSRLEEMRRAAPSATGPVTGKAKADPGGMRRVGLGRIITVAGVTKMGIGGTLTKGVGGTLTKGVGGTLTKGVGGTLTKGVGGTPTKGVGEILTTTGGQGPPGAMPKRIHGGMTPSKNAETEKMSLPPLTDRLAARCLAPAPRVAAGRGPR